MLKVLLRLSYFCQSLIIRHSIWSYPSTPAQGPRQDKFAAAWSAVASAVAQDNPGVMGIEILNEPWVGDIYADPLLLVGGIFNIAYKFCLVLQIFSSAWKPAITCSGSVNSFLSRQGRQAESSPALRPGTKGAARSCAGSSHHVPRLGGIFSLELSQCFQAFRHFW